MKKYKLSLLLNSSFRLLIFTVALIFSTALFSNMQLFAQSSVNSAVSAAFDVAGSTTLFQARVDYKETLNLMSDKAPTYKSLLKIELNNGYFYKESSFFKFAESFIGKGSISILTKEKEKIDPFSKKMIKIYPSPLEIEITVNSFPETAAIQADYQGCAGEVCLMPVSKKIILFKNLIKSSDSNIIKKTPATAKTPAMATTKEEKNNFEKKGSEKNDFEKKGVFGILLGMFLAGIAASMTPCVWPMIPVTVGILGSLAGGSRLKGFFYSLVYVLGISITYSIMGIAAAKTGGAFGEISGNPWVIATVSIVFFIFGLAMFDVFTIQISGKTTAFLQKQRSGIFGVFLMGLLAGLVASPCIAPLIATLLAYVAKTGNTFIGAAGLGAFAWGMGILFIILGTFSGAMNYLPKSGMWMIKVKYLMGLLMIFASLYFINPILNPLFFNILTAFILIIFSVGRIHTLGNASNNKTADILEKSIVTIMFITAISIIFFTVQTLFFPGALMQSSPGASEQLNAQQQENNKWLKDYDKALEIAANEKKGIILDFYTQWCVQCKKLDSQVFKSPEFEKAAKDIIKIKIDMTKGAIPEKRVDFFKKKYNIWGYPRVVFLDHQGNEVKKLAFNGFLDKQGVIEKIQILNNK